MNGLFPVVLVCSGVSFALFLGIIAFALYGALTERARNNAMPVESVDARVVAKRADTSGIHGGAVSTVYYVTYELRDGERVEYRVTGKEFGMLVEGDRGTLTHQGTRYEGFERE